MLTEALHCVRREYPYNRFWPSVELAAVTAHQVSSQFQRLLVMLDMGGNAGGGMVGLCVSKLNLRCGRSCRAASYRLSALYRPAC